MRHKQQFTSYIFLYVCITIYILKLDIVTCNKNGLVVT